MRKKQSESNWSFFFYSIVVRKIYKIQGTVKEDKSFGNTSELAICV